MRFLTFEDFGGGLRGVDSLKLSPEEDLEVSLSVSHRSFLDRDWFRHSSFEKPTNAITLGIGFLTPAFQAEKYTVAAAFSFSVRSSDIFDE